MKTRCDSCGHETDEDKIIDLYEVKHLLTRIEAGQEVPAGECRKCGALVYLISKKKVFLAKARIKKDSAANWRIIQAETAKRVYQLLAGKRAEQDARREFEVHEIKLEVA